MNLSTDRRNLWHPYASTKTPPPVNAAESASGTHIRLESGEELIDAISSWWCAGHGHCRPEIIGAIREQALHLPHIMFAGFTHAPAVELTEELLKVLPQGIDKVFFADSGSIAVECALKMAVQYQNALGFKNRSRFVSLKGDYHGDTIGAMSVSDPDGMHILFRGLLPQNLFAERPACRFGGEWNDSFFLSMDRILDGHADEIAGVIVEPVFQGANAMWFYHPEYLRKLRAACDRHGIVLIFDEIATGFGRTGRLFAQEYAGVKPDIMCIGKLLTGGEITLAAAVASARIADPIPALMHGPTFMANPLACAAAKASVKLLSSYDWKGNVARIESVLKKQLEPCRALPNVKDVRVLGAVGVLEVGKIPSPETTQKIVLETGVWLRPYANFIYTMPPYITPDSELEQIASAMKRLAEA